MQKHVCYMCGKEAIYQLKNGNWCCKPNARCCQVVKEKVSLKAKQKWKELKNKNIKYRKDIPIQQRTGIIDFGQQHVCFYCGKYAEYKLTNGRWCCQKSYNSCPMNRYKNSKTQQQRYQQGLIDLSYLHQKGHIPWNKGLTAKTSDSVKNGANTLKEGYLSGRIHPPQLGKQRTPEEKKSIIHGMTHFRTGINKKGFKHGWYKGYWCDSSWQLAFIIYNLEHEIKFERNNEGFSYQYQNKELMFFPDFIINNEYIQIKGFPSEQTNAKIKYFPSNKILHVYYKKEMQVYLNYAKEKYGVDFWKLLSAENLK